MPAGQVQPGQTVPALALVGTHADDSFVIRHVGMLRDATAINGPVTVYDQCPPPQLPPGPPVQTMQADVCGFLPLGTDEVQGMLVEMGRLRTLLDTANPSPIETYVALPSSVEVPDERGNPLYFRFSCAGLVQHVYREIGIVLVDERDLPDVALADILPIWPHAKSQRLREYFGLRGAGPWPTLLPGYFFHALARYGARPQSPYRPAASDRRFP